MINDVAALKNTGAWPMWPIMPVKHPKRDGRGWPTLGAIVASDVEGGGKIRVFDVDLLSVPKTMKELAAKELHDSFDTVEAMVEAGWVGD